MVLVFLVLVLDQIMQIVDIVNKIRSDGILDPRVEIIIKLFNHRFDVFVYCIDNPMDVYNRI